MKTNKTEQVPGFVPYGGLGNQLFQFATALSLCDGKNDRLSIDLIGRERINSDGLPEIMDFDLEKITRIMIRNKTSSSFLKYLVEIQLRLSNKVLQNRILNSFLSFLQIIVSQVTSALVGTSVLSPRGMGWDDKFRCSKKSYTVLGNFHSHLFVNPKLRRTLKANLKSRGKTEVVENFLNMASNEKPVAIHIRLGDYLSIDELNVVNKDYFARAIELIEVEKPGSNYWIFTNDESMANEYLPAFVLSRTRFIPQYLNSAQTMEVMWHCDRYIISNSTFSWWGAFLSVCDKPLVIAPKKWFKNLDEPLNICPPEWIRL